ncbi:MAG: hypothetical protein IH897_10850 [Planctomycetes bacterium]|nr:hypothetical protein [Planctomycetota bacterium]
MDPDDGFSALLDCLTNDNLAEAAEHAEDLLTWLDRSGFPPGGGKLRLSAIRDFCDWVISQSN